MSKPVSFLSAIAMAILMMPAPARAAAVSGWSATDGFSALPTARGSALVDTRLALGLPGGPSSIMNVAVGALDGLEIGLGTAMAPGGSAVALAYPWVRGLSPWQPVPALRLGYMLGADLPALTGGASYGATVLADVAVGPATLGLNAGYKRVSSAPTPDVLAANLNATWPLGRLTLYEEAFVNQRLAGTRDFGLRSSVGYAVDAHLQLDASPAVLIGPTIDVVPNVGATYTF